MASYKEQYYSLSEDEMQDLIAKAKTRKSVGPKRIIKSIQ